jgi:3-oxoacyl-(acyl-carrier-protein) synthase
VDEAIDLNVVLGAPRPINPNGVGLSTSFAFGGANAALILSGCPEGAS